MKTPSTISACMLLAGAVVACGYKLQAVDVTALENMAPNCAANVALLAEAGPAYAQERASDRTCVCTARGILARAGQPLPDAGRSGCPQ